jgi:hypothetical protein
MSRRVILLGLLLISLGSISAAPPAWWASRGATNANPPNDHAAVNQGQLKQFTRKAVDELNSTIPGGAGPELDNLIAAWVAGHPDPKDTQAMAIGQLKWIADKIHARLLFAKYSSSLPAWLAQVPATDNQAANLGQLKTVFNFDLSAPPGQLPVWWQKFYFNGQTNIAPSGDADSDGTSNLNEYLNHTNPNDPITTPDTDGDGLLDAWEMLHFLILDQTGFGDPDEDGYNNFEELALNTDPMVATAPLADADGDRMPDVYETAYGLSPTIENSLEDADGDGVPNLFEYKRGTSPTDAGSKPPVDLIVDPQLGDVSPADNVFSKIQDALNFAMYSGWDDVLDQPEPPRPPYQVISIKPGTYHESLYLVNVPLLLIAEQSETKSPVIIDGADYDASVTLESASVLRGMVLTHSAGKVGPGLRVVYYDPVFWDEFADPDPVSFSRRGLVNCMIIGNTNGDGAGGIYMDASNGLPNLSLVHCTVTGNTGPVTSAGIYQGDAGLNLFNSIVWGNTSNPADASSRQIFTSPGFSLLVSAAAPSFVGDPNTASLPGWRDAVDPLLTPRGWLKPLSPAINAGGIIPGALVPRDIQGESRTADAAPDIGADEYRDANSIADGDGVPDWAEGADDHDGLTALDEYQLYGTDPLLADTDGDGMNDGVEITNHFDPLVKEDNDLDGMPDVWEFTNGLDWHVDDSLDDFDGDRIPNIFESHYDTAANDLTDAPQVTFEVNPATGDNDPDDNIYSTVNDALSAVVARDDNHDGSADPYPIILVHSGVYSEKVDVSGVPMLLLGEPGAVTGPVEILSDQIGPALSISSASVVDGFVISHQSGATGIGVSVAGPFFGGETRRRRLINCIITGNTSDNAGGIDAFDCELDLVHCTVVGNASTGFFPGIRLRFSNLNLFNTVIAGNTGTPSAFYQQIAADSMSQVLPSNSCPSLVGDAPPTPTPGWIMVSDPGLTSAGYVQDAYSSVVNSGGGIPSTMVRYDLQGQLRSAGGIPDIGADEFIPEYTDPEEPEPGSGSSVDSDGDGIPDQWEITHDLDLLTPNPESDLQDYLNESANTSELLIHTPLQ